MEATDGKTAAESSLSLERCFTFQCQFCKEWFKSSQSRDSHISDCSKKPNGWETPDSKKKKGHKNNRGSGRRTAFSLLDKINIIKDFEASGLVVATYVKEKRLGRRFEKYLGTSKTGWRYAETRAKLFACQDHAKSAKGRTSPKKRLAAVKRIPYKLVGRQVPQWPLLEAELFHVVKKRWLATKKNRVPNSWVRTTAKELHKKLYPDAPDGSFAASVGWHLRFQKRHNINFGRKQPFERERGNPLDDHQLDGAVVMDAAAAASESFEEADLSQICDEKAPVAVADDENPMMAAGLDSEDCNMDHDGQKKHVTGQTEMDKEAQAADTESGDSCSYRNAPKKTSTTSVAKGKRTVFTPLDKIGIIQDFEASRMSVTEYVRARRLDNNFRKYLGTGERGWRSPAMKAKLFDGSAPKKFSSFSKHLKRR